MQDGEHDVLNVPGFGEAPNSVVGENRNKLLVVATLAALFLAGSAFAYRNRPFYFSSTTSPLLTAPSQNDKSNLASSKSAQKKKSDSQREDAAGNEQDSDALGSANMVSGSMSPATLTHDSEATNQSRTSRRKDRRKRGKDPLKEIMKGGKKFKALAPSSAGSTNNDPAAGAFPSAKSDITHFENVDSGFVGEHADDHDTASQASSSTSHFTPDFRQTQSRRKGKQAQREELYDTKGAGTTEEEGLFLVGNTSVSRLFRGTTTSEVSQKQYLQQSSDGPSSSLYSSSKNPTLPRSEHNNTNATRSESGLHSPNPYGSLNNQPSSSLAFKDDRGLQKPHSTLPASTSSSKRATSHTDIDDHDDNNIQAADLEQENPLTEESQVHQLSLADADTNSEADFIEGSRLRGTESGKQMVEDRARLPINVEISFDTSTVETSSTSTTTATGPASLSSSLVLSSPATSPPLSSSPYSVEQFQTDVKPFGGDDNDADVDVISALHQPRQDKTSSTSTSAKFPSSSLSFTSDSTTAGKSSSRKSPQIEAHGGNLNKRKSILPNQNSDPWDWDGVSSSASVSSKHESSREIGNEKQASNPSSRLPPESLKTGPSFSAVGISSSATHPASFYSPTKSSFAASVSSSLTPGLAMASSVSAVGTSSTRTSLVTSSLGMGPDAQPEGSKQGEEGDAFVFPTLNPTATTNGYSSAGSGRPSTSRRAPTPRRPGTPSRSSSTGTPPPSSSSSVAGVNTTSSSSSNTHGTYSNSVNTATMSASNSSNSIPALSTQTQLASLRGALEAARLREEKNKADTEKYIKEMDMLRWENANWRRGEVELKAHVQHLMHQLQTYAAFYNNAAPHLNAQFQQQQQQVNGNNVPANPASSGPLTSSAPNGIAGTSGSTAVPSTPQSEQASSSISPASSTPPNTQPSQLQPPSQASSPAIPHPPPPPLHLHQMASPQMNGPISSPGVLSPLGGMFSPAAVGGAINNPTVVNVHPGTPSFFPYPVPHPMMLQAQQMHMMQQQLLHHHQQQSQQSALPSPYQANIFSSIFSPGAPPPLMSPHQQHHYPAFAAAQAQIQQIHASSSTSQLASGPSSNAGSSSAGSLSPDLSGSSSSGGRRSRAKANGRTLGRKSWEGMGDGWVEGATPEERNGNVGENPAPDEENDSGISELLADAILKRPGSIRIQSSSTRRGQLNFDQEAKTEEDAGDSSPVQRSDENTQVEQLTEFTFPSISDHYKGYGLSIDEPSSSVSASSPSLDSAATGNTDEVSEGQDKLDALDHTNEPAAEAPLNAAVIEDVAYGVASPTSSSQESDTTPRKEVAESNIVNTTVDPEQDTKQQQLPEKTDAHAEH